MLNGMRVSKQQRIMSDNEEVKVDDANERYEDEPGTKYVM